MRSASARKTVVNLTPDAERIRPRSDAEAGGQLHSIGLELRRTDRAVEADLQARLASIGLQIGMWLYLRALWHEDGLTQSELARRVRASKPTTLAQLRRMELRGLIRFERRSKDKRLVRVRLTPEGRALKPKLLPIARLNHNAALAGFKKAEMEMLFNALARIRKNVAKRGSNY
ncbi:MAG TPA: MarR family transcriptional regulator [Xanthobacteraceae bacterium]|jgi:DNA-binding MarR family transcriptional regulator